MATDTGTPDTPEPPRTPKIPGATRSPETSGTPGASGGELIRFEKVCKRFGGHVVLDELDFTVDPGKHLTLIGPSGSGKTTILRLLMTLTKPDTGRILVDGQPLDKEVRKRIGMVFQQFNLFPNMRVLRNVTEAPVHVLGLSKDEAVARAKELLEMVGLGDKLDAYPAHLSGGQQQRVAIARALAMRPKVLLLDEVTSALDPELVAGVLDVLRDIARTTDITMVTVTHEMAFARDISDQVLMFDAGRVVESGPPEQLFSEPRHQRTRDFLSAVL